MKANPTLTCVVVAMAAGTAGYFLPHPAGKPDPGGTATKIQAVESRTATGSALPLPASIARIIAGASLSGSNANAFTYRALEEANPVTRMAAVGVLLESMTEENGPAIYQAFLDITKKTGRRHDGEWSLMLKRYGEVMGPSCIALLADNKANLALAVEGWAYADPDEARKALKKAGIEGPAIDTGWLTGICRKDPDKALALALSGNYAGIDCAALIAQSINTSGLEGAREALQNAINNASTTTAAEPVFQNLFNALAETMLHKNKTDGTPEAMLSWLKQQKGQPYLTSGIIDSVAFENCTYGNPVEAIKWLGEINESHDGEVMGVRGIIKAIKENPAIMDKVDEATFDLFMQALPKTPGVYQALAQMLAKNPARADKLIAATPKE